MEKQINKLVRDRIPELCRQDGKTPRVKILDEESYTLALQSKLKEEVAEYLADQNIEELADILEVVQALAENQGHCLDDVIEIKNRKQSKNGAFKDRIYLISVED